MTDELKPRTELDALLERVVDVRYNAAHPDRNGVAYGCLRMFEQVVNELKRLRSQAHEFVAIENAGPHAWETDQLRDLRERLSASEERVKALEDALAATPCSCNTWSACEDCSETKLFYCKKDDPRPDKCRDCGGHLKYIAWKQCDRCAALLSHPPQAPSGEAGA